MKTAMNNTSAGCKIDKNYKPNPNEFWELLERVGFDKKRVNRYKKQLTK